jgi:hypothetical protein
LLSLPLSDTNPKPNNKMTSKLPIYRKGSIRYAITPQGEARPLVRRNQYSGCYRNSKKSVPEGLPWGHYLGKPSKVDQTEIDFVEVGVFETSGDWTRLVSA